MIRIVVFDDHKDFLELIRREFKKAGITDFETHSDYEDFIDAVDYNTDIGLIDLVIKGTGLTGINLMRQVFKKSSSCRVIIMSAHLDVAAIERCTNNGAWKAMDKSRDTFFDDLIYFIKQEMPVIEIEHRLRK